MMTTQTKSKVTKASPPFMALTVVNTVGKTTAGKLEEHFKLLSAICPKAKIKKKQPAQEKANIKAILDALPCLSEPVAIQILNLAELLSEQVDGLSGLENGYQDYEATGYSMAFLTLLGIFNIKADADKRQPVHITDGMAKAVTQAYLDQVSVDAIDMARKLIKGLGKGQAVRLTRIVEGTIPENEVDEILDVKAEASSIPLSWKKAMVLAEACQLITRKPGDEAEKKPKGKKGKKETSGKADEPPKDEKPQEEPAEASERTGKKGMVAKGRLKEITHKEVADTRAVTFGAGCKDIIIYNSKGEPEYLPIEVKVKDMDSRAYAQFMQLLGLEELDEHTILEVQVRAPSQQTKLDVEEKK